KAKAVAKPKAEAAKPKPEAEASETKETTALPAGYADLTIAAIKDAVGSWDKAAVTAALERERAHGNRKGAISALEGAFGEEGQEGEGRQEGSRLLEERTRLPVQAAGCEDLRRSAGEGGDDHRPPARDEVPARSRDGTRPRRHDLRDPRRCGRVPPQRR